MKFKSTSLRFSSICLSLALAGCATAQKDYSYMSEPNYQKRTTLTQALVPDGEHMSEDAIKKILSSRVVLPKSISLAVVRLSDVGDGLGFQTIDEDIAAQFYNKAAWGTRVQTIIPVPQILIGRPVTLTSLRQAAIMLQADALLIVRPVSYGDWKMRLFEDNKAKGISTLEVLLLDTRTSVVPFTELVTESVELTKDKADYTDYEMVNRAKKASENKALLKIAPELQRFFSKAI